MLGRDILCGDVHVLVSWMYATVSVYLHVLTTCGDKEVIRKFQISSNNIPLVMQNHCSLFHHSYLNSYDVQA